MKITFDCPDKINGVMTMVIEPADYVRDRCPWE